MSSASLLAARWLGWHSALQYPVAFQAGLPPCRTSGIAGGHTAPPRGYLHSGPSQPLGRIGTEHEKLGYNIADTRRLSYEQIAALLTRIQERFGWEPIIEEGNIIGLTQVGVARLHARLPPAGPGPPAHAAVGGICLVGSATDGAYFRLRCSSLLM